jgi:hypothetical protein
MQTQIKPNPDVLFQIFDNEAVLLHLKTEIYYSLNDVGTRIWQLLEEQEHATVESLIAQLLKEYEVDAETLQKDIHDLLEELTQAQLVQVG